MYKNDEEITNEVVFTRLLRAMDCFSDDDVFEKRTREALARVESSDDRGMSKSQFLDELDSW